MFSISPSPFFPCHYFPQWDKGEVTQIASVVYGNANACFSVISVNGFARDSQLMGETKHLDKQRPTNGRAQCFPVSLIQHILLSVHSILSIVRQGCSNEQIRWKSLPSWSLYSSGGKVIRNKQMRCSSLMLISAKENAEEVKGHSLFQHRESIVVLNEVIS